MRMPGVARAVFALAAVACGLMAVLLARGSGDAAATATRLEHARSVTVRVTMGRPSEYAFTFSPKSVRHGRVVFDIVNAGKVAHSFEIDGHRTRSIRPHRSTRLEVLFRRAGRYVYQCVQGPSAPIQDPDEGPIEPPCAGGVFKVT